MVRVRTRLSRLFLAAALASAALSPALAEQAVLKLGGAEGESAASGHQREIEIESFSWGAAADPDEGAGADSFSYRAPVAQSAPVGSAFGSGGEEQRANDRLRTAGPALADLTPPKRVDKASPMLGNAGRRDGGEAGPRSRPISLIPRQEIVSPRDVAGGQATGKRQHLPVTMTRGSLIALMPEGACVAGARYPTAALLTGSQAFAMQDVTVAGCAPTATAKGRKDKARLDYMIVKMETVLVSG